MRTFFQRSVAALLLLGSTFCQTASADSLDRLITALSEKVVLEYQAFRYVQLPDTPWPPGTMVDYRVSNSVLAFVMMKPEKTLETTGFDYAKLSEVFETGQPPEEMTILVGQPGFADKAAEAFAANSYTSSKETGLVVFAKGDDFSIDNANKTQKDPFTMLGEAQRVALDGNLVVRARGWQPLRRALATMAKPEDCTACVVWMPTIKALRSKMQPQDRIHVAAGYGAVAFMSVFAAQTAESIFLSGALPEQADAVQPLVPSAATLIAATGNDKEGAVWIVMHAANAEQAQSMARTVATRLTSRISLRSSKIPPLSAAPQTEVLASGNQHLALVKTVLPNAIDAIKMANRWQDLIAQRDFVPLAADTPLPAP